MYTYFLLHIYIMYIHIKCLYVGMQALYILEDT